MRVGTPVGFAFGWVVAFVDGVPFWFCPVLVPPHAARPSRHAVVKIINARCRRIIAILAISLWLEWQDALLRLHATFVVTSMLGVHGGAPRKIRKSARENAHKKTE